MINQQTNIILNNDNLYIYTSDGLIFENKIFDINNNNFIVQQFKHNFISSNKKYTWYVNDQKNLEFYKYGSESTYADSEIIFSENIDEINNNIKEIISVDLLETKHQINIVLLVTLEKKYQFCNSEIDNKYIDVDKFYNKYYKNYSLIFIKYFLDQIQINQINLCDNIYIDQIPTTVKYLCLSNNNSIIIYGTNGLLKLYAFHKYYSIIDNITKPTHKINSCITCVEYYNNILTTADNFGILCIWKICLNTLNFTILKIIDFFESPKIINVQILKLTNFIFVTTVNKLFIVNYFDQIKKYKIIINKKNSYKRVNKHKKINIKYCIMSTDNVSVYYSINNNDTIQIIKVSENPFLKNNIKNNTEYNIKDFNNIIFININSFLILKSDIYSKNILLTNNTLFNKILKIENSYEHSYEKIKIFNPITFDIESSNNKLLNNNTLIIKQKDQYYYTTKKLINDFIISNVNNNSYNLKKIGIISSNIKKESIEKLLSISTTNIFEIIDFKISESEIFAEIFPLENINFVNVKIINEKIYNFNCNKNNIFCNLLNNIFGNESNKKYTNNKLIIEIYFSCFEKPMPLLLLNEKLISDLKTNLLDLFEINEDLQVVNIKYNYFLDIISFENYELIGKDYWIDIKNGHNYLLQLHLKYYCDKFITNNNQLEICNDYFKKYGGLHFYYTSRMLKNMTTDIVKIDETINFTDIIPKQIEYLTNLQEIYIRSNNIQGFIPNEIGNLNYLRILSLGNNNLIGNIPKSISNLIHLDRIAIHNNNLSGYIPEMPNNNCIFNLSGNINLNYQYDILESEKNALLNLYLILKNSNSFDEIDDLNWNNEISINLWKHIGIYKNHIHTIIMSNKSFNLNFFPKNFNDLKEIRLIEFGNIPNLKTTIDPFCDLKELRRLCIWNTGLTGQIPNEIGNLINLVELQLFGNELNGKISNSIGLLVNLKLLSLGEFTGHNNFDENYFPECIKNLINLKQLYLVKCSIKGNIPEWLGLKLLKLEKLDLQNNLFVGNIPNTIKNLIHLDYFNLKNNNIIDFSVDDISCLTKLKKINLISNLFSSEKINQLKHNLSNCHVFV
jgi:hypothetical protein